MIRTLGMTLTLSLACLPATLCARPAGASPLDTRFMGIHERQSLDPPAAEEPVPASARMDAPRHLSRQVLGFLPWWVSSSVWRQLPSSLLSHVAWFSLELGPTGEAVADNGWPIEGLPDTLRHREARLLLCATQFNSSDLRTLLSQPAHRATARAVLLEHLRVGDADGLMIDFEGLPADQFTAFPQFLAELRADLEMEGEVQGRPLDLMACTPAVDWAGAYDYSAIAEICDAQFLMAYDYRWTGSPTTGPVAPALGWGTWNVAWSVADHLAWNGQRRDRLLLGLPWYGYDWPSMDDLPGGATRGVGSARSLAAAHTLADNHGWRREEVADTPWSCRQDNGWRQCWFDDTLSLGCKIQLAVDEDLLGVGIWALGYEGGHGEVWQQLLDRLAVTGGEAEHLQLDITVSNGHVRLSWEPLPGALGYSVWGASAWPVPEDAWLLLHDGGETSWSAPWADLRWFRVTAHMAGRMSGDQREPSSGRPAGTTSR